MFVILHGATVDNSHSSSSDRDSWSESWRRYCGPHWRVLLFVFSFLLLVRGFIETLSDPDLPMHLALGEWIVEHRAVPTVEPFAWTRAGAPFYAYSWAIEVLLHFVSEATGKIGLRVLHGLTVAGAFLSMIVLGRAARWDPRTTLIMSVLNVTMLAIIVNSFRPQSVLFSLVPLAWAFTLRALDAPRPWRALVALAITSAVTANSHAFFPLTALGWLSWLAEPRQDRKRVLAVVAVTLFGWIASPYATMLPDILELNGRSNPLLESPSPISELQPGFVVMGLSPIVMPIVVFLTCLPWICGDMLRTRRAAVVFGAAWLFGLVQFATTARLLLLWWMLVLPLAALAIARISHYLMATEKQGVRLWRITSVWAVCSVLFLTSSPFEPDLWAFENPAKRRLGPMYDNGIDHLATWLECNTIPSARGRVFTGFDFGSALTWRLPQYSMSIDGRTIFPDSVAKPEALYELFNERLREGTWHSADLAILAIPSAIADGLDNAQGWKKAAVAHRADRSTALWVREVWWAKAGTAGLSDQPVPLMPAGELTDSCPRPLPSSRRSTTP